MLISSDMFTEITAWMLQQETGQSKYFFYLNGRMCLHRNVFAEVVESLLSVYI